MSTLKEFFKVVLQKCDKNHEKTCKSVIKSSENLAKMWFNSIINIESSILLIGDDNFEEIYNRKTKRMERK